MASTDPFSGFEEIVCQNVPLAPLTWYHVGGSARWMIHPRNPDELQAAARRCIENGIRVYVLGLGANLLVSDAGVDAAVFRLDAEYFKQLNIKGDLLEVGAGADMQKLPSRCVRMGLSGVECLAGIPGTIGGGVRMNAGGKFGDIGSVVNRVTVMSVDGEIFDRTKDDLVFGYRKSNIAATFILKAELEMEADEPEAILKRTREIWMYKKNSQPPMSEHTAGCIFKNPSESKLGAGALIDQAALKGTRIGGAEVSTKHANFIVAYPGCKADDILRLIDLVKTKVQTVHGVSLEQEVVVWR